MEVREHPDHADACFVKDVFPDPTVNPERFSSRLVHRTVRRGASREPVVEEKRL
jgi:hypothetical protein